MNFFKGHKKDKKAKKNNSANTQYTTYQRVDCSAKHLSPIHLGSGLLYGLPGKDHSKDLKDVNIFLLDTYLPWGCYSNCFVDGKRLHDIIYFPIDDRDIPVDVDDFYRVLKFAIKKLNAGKSVGISCFGGHGRTGMVLAILYGIFHKEEKDPIAAIRKMGCDKWVESFKQAAFVYAVLGIDMPFESLYKEYEKGGYSYGSSTAYHGATGFGWY